MSDAATRLVVLVPALAALVGLLVARRTDLRAARFVAVGASALAIVVALLEVIGVHGSAGAGTVSSIPALHAGELRIPLLLQATTATATIALVVAVVGWAVQVFAGWYLRDDDRYGIFAATVSLFTGGMLLVVQSADLVLTLVGWEVMGWCSYLLIGHWSRKESARRAALKAFLVTRLADVGFVLGVVILAAGASSTAYPQVLQAVGRHRLQRRGRVRRAEPRDCSTPPWCCSSSASSASRAWCRSTTGCPTRWRARPPPPR